MDKIKKFIIDNWANMPITEMAEKYTLNQILEVALELHLYKINTPNIGRRWTIEEDEFLTKNAHQLSISQASSLLYRSHYATYQRVRMLGLGNLMINKK